MVVNLSQINCLWVDNNIRRPTSINVFIIVIAGNYANAKIKPTSISIRPKKIEKDQYFILLFREIQYHSNHNHNQNIGLSHQNNIYFYLYPTSPSSSAAACTVCGIFIFTAPSIKKKHQMLTLLMVLYSIITHLDLI